MSMFETSMKTEVLVKKLHARQKVLKARRPAEIKKYNDAILAWKKKMAAWLKENAVDRISTITKTDLQSNENNHRWGNNPGFDVATFFRGAPRPPVFPPEKQLRGIQKLLRQLAITGQATVRFTSTEVDALFADPDDVKSDD